MAHTHTQALAAELKTLQGALADLNVMQDRLHSHAGLAELTQLRDDLRSRNDAEARAVDAVFAQAKRLEQRAAQEEQAILAEKSFNARLVDAMTAEQRQQHAALETATQHVAQVSVQAPPFFVAERGSCAP